MRLPRRVISWAGDTAAAIRLAGVLLSKQNESLARRRDLSLGSLALVLVDETRGARHLISLCAVAVVRHFALCSS